MNNSSLIKIFLNSHHFLKKFDIWDKKSICRNPFKNWSFDSDFGYITNFNDGADNYEWEYFCYEDETKGNLPNFQTLVISKDFQSVLFYIIEKLDGDLYSGTNEKLYIYSIENDQFNSMRTFPKIPADLFFKIYSDIKNAHNVSTMRITN